MSQNFFVTGAIPYVNAAPHIGHALEFVQTDAIARYHKLLGHETLTLCGGDENALKNVQAAEKAGKDIQSFVDKHNDLFFNLTRALNCQHDIWQKGSSSQHHAASQHLWNLVKKHNPHDIYEKEYEGLYCVGCETFYAKEELNEKGECFEHPGKPLEHVREKNYFFRLSNYEDQLREIISSKQIKIYPEHRTNEVLQFIDQGLKDISISRSNARAKNWGVPVPDDDTQRMYVWFDALNIYQSGIGFGWDEKNYNKWWPADVHVIGKGILRFHAVYWPAFLLAANLKLPKSIFVHDYFTVNGQKMSKTLGNVIDPIDLIEKYGSDALRYYFLARFSPFHDGDFSESDFKTVYNADLANGLGNLVARVAKLCEEVTLSPIFDEKLFPEYEFSMNEYRFNDALAFLWTKIGETDKFINDTEPWKITDTDKLAKVLRKAVEEILVVAFHLQPFLPETADKIMSQFTAPKITPQPSLFPRIG